MAPCGLHFIYLLSFVGVFILTNPNGLYGGKSPQNTRTGQTLRRRRTSNSRSDGLSGMQELSDVGGPDGERVSAGLSLLRSTLLHRAEFVERLIPYGWKFQPGFQGIALPQTTNVTKFIQSLRGDFQLHLSGLILNTSQTILFSVVDPRRSLPFIELSLDLIENRIILRYLGTTSFQRATLMNVFPDGVRWTFLYIFVREKEFVAHADCKGTVVSTMLRQKIGTLPDSAHVVFGSKSYRQHGLQGVVFHAMVFNESGRRRADCSAKLDYLVNDQPLDSGSGFILTSSDGPTEVDQRIVSLEQQLAQLSFLVESLQTENAELKQRVAHLETCECVPSCSFNGSVFQEGDIWFPEECTQCQCINSKSECSRRLDVLHCAEPCISSPCLNNGKCLNPDTEIATASFQCECQSPYNGDMCQVRQNPCVWPVQPGNCHQEIVRYYYDNLSQMCLAFMFSGCGGNVNNFLSLEECTRIALTGACCYRTYKTNIDDVARSTQEVEIKCQELHMEECKTLHHQPGENTETEVISFNPGLTCDEAACQITNVCVIGQRVYQVGDEMELGCQKCQCKPLGQISCECNQVSTRIEIRDMTQEQLVRFQNAVKQLRASNDRTWEQFRDLYMYHVMHSGGGPFYLPWQRAFLRQMEQRLQEIDCRITLPYFDFTTDVGFFEEAVLWDSLLYGGNGDGKCVQDHPFGSDDIWQPCLVRNFNTSIQLPSRMELHLALANDDYEEMSSSLETYIAYLHNFIGGDMMTSSSPYDPVFYAIHSFVDMLYWSWQQRGENKFKFPAAYGNIPMIPFNIPPWAVFNSERDVCVSYALPSRGHPCNLTVVDVPRRRQPAGRSDTEPDVIEYERQHLTKYTGFFNMSNTGYNQDGYDAKGFDFGGFDRYGFNVKGFDRYGYDINGVDLYGNVDNTGRFNSQGYDMECLNREGLTKDGLDQYGFYKTGVDVDRCTFYFTGPFSTIHSYQIHSVLSRQPKSFLMELTRTCPSLDPLPSHWIKINWVSRTKNISDLVPVHMPAMQSGPSSRFCFDTRHYLTPCRCDSGRIAECQSNPCFKKTCKAFPEAVCRIDFCGQCSARWFYRGKEIDCRTDRDHCDPNPCYNGGTCQKSEWPQEPHFITCQCPPGFDGHLCQHHVLDTCVLPVSRGSCESREERWYYNSKSGRCERFMYLGCKGNANNFESIVDCQNQCVKGSCCWREPLHRNQEIGYDNQGYDKYGFSMEGYNRFGDKRSIQNSFPFGTQLFDSEGYDWQGFDQDGFGTEDNLNRAGYDKNGYDSEGFNLTGYRRNGEYDGIIDYNDDGYDSEGFNRAGLSCQGNDRQGYDIHGVSGAYKHSCQITTLSRCQENAREGLEIIKFTPGKTCDESGCGEECGCRHGNKTFRVYEKLTVGCQSCTCSEKGVFACSCDYTVKRKEIRDLTEDEMKRYQNAVRKLIEETRYPSQWYQFASLYSSHMPISMGSPVFLPWNRQFLRHVEQAIQETDCSIAIPYYDWTVDAGKPHKTAIWSASMMGGNGNSDNDCVRYHPFKSYHPPYLTPCLRRNFNSSMTLPSAVNIELALRETLYDRFRLQMEVFFHIYQGFVGGHMNTNLAPYDPMFYSVMAYVDKLWTEWQTRHPLSLLSFPLNHRYARLSPFKSTPDDVFESDKQLCVDYIQLTEGSLCNTTDTWQKGFNSQGYDRHGYNREGFDKDGYNVDGVDVSQNSDNRGIYNAHGFDRQGFSRSGFDSMGIDRYGFFTDSYNLDHIDTDGYDRSGYNRYGFSQHGFTPYGYNINGSRLGNINIGDLNLFDPFGYNKYGYDQEGFDRNGYDIFGFDSKGYNSLVCDKYFHGPIYILVKSYVTNTVKALDGILLNNVKRICSPLMPLQGHVIKHNWLNRNRQRAVIRELHRNQQENHAHDSTYIPRETSVTVDLIWLPIAPDERLCVVTEVFTNCKLWENEVLCTSDLCANKVCPGHPTALCRMITCGECKKEWYDGLTGQLLQCSGCLDESGQERREGETWTDPVNSCHTCTCRDGESLCQAITCPTVSCQYPVQLDDQCCPSCDGCDYRGQVYLSGSDFQLEDDVCSRCRCINGNVQCSFVECPDLGECKSKVIPTDQCCEICMDCGEHSHGDTWKPDPCQECQCLGGQVRCSRTVCERPTCSYPSRLPGECCASCSACLYEGVLRQNGESFIPRPCDQCTCRNGNVDCNTIICAKPKCSNPVRVNDQCCPMCGLDCEYEGQRYLDETNFSPSYSPCMNCSCANSIVRCHSVRCPPSNLPCRNPVRKRGECCPSTCPKCEDQGVKHEEGESWPSPDSPCEVCHCINGAVVCKPKLDCITQCTHGVVRRGECCSKCNDCLFEGRVIPQNEEITIHGDICRQCVCHGGNLQCKNVVTARECPRLVCEQTELRPESCCPVCAGCVYRGQRFEHGALVIKDKCSECICDQGEISCQDPVCPETQCFNPRKIEGQCCPVCDSCVHYGIEYQNGDSFRSRYDTCQQCTCLRGKVSCVSVESTCPEVPCTHPGRRKDQCCPQCDTCQYKRRTLRNGQRFTGSSPCDICVCEQGSVICTRMECPPVKCSKPVTKPGRCCPKCEGVCMLNGKEYLEGQTFQRPGSECSTCTCQNNQVTCKTSTCQPLTCKHPARLPNECCPKCSFCLYERRIFRNQQRFVHPQDLCQQCSCQFGTVTCANTVCEELTCSNPMAMPGSCCPSCPKQCSHYGLFYDDGETFINPQNKCEDCLCRQGTSHCKARMCPRVTCANPVFDGCCQKCTDCKIGELVVQNGRTETDPNDKCQTCECRDGDLRCQSVSCPSISCTNPVLIGCCPFCGDCEFRGRLYENGAVMTGADRCRTCVCQDGNVECQPNICPAITCKHPSRGQCCKECKDCFHQGVTYVDGESFSDTNVDSCQSCICSKGTVMCTLRACPAVTCTHPTQGRCCKECRNCFFNGITLTEGRAVTNPNDACEQCQCSKGSVNCYSKRCPDAGRCRHPVTRGCCAECTDCSYAGREYNNGEDFDDPASGCISCRCTNGEVICQPRECPTAQCTNPVQGECCLECDSCSYNGRTMQDRQRFLSAINKCEDCVCNKGNVECYPTDCSKYPQCSHPISVPNECCPVCGRDCLYNKRVIQNGASFEENCQECMCHGGDIACQPKSCPRVQCLNPVLDGCCQVCLDCQVDGQRYVNGQIFPDRRDTCSQCECLDGTISCSLRTCPLTPCTHPRRGLCCDECDGCQYNRIELTNGQRLTDPNDRCMDCVCQLGSMVCNRKRCPPVSCQDPVKDECDCPSCDACLFQRLRYKNGERFQNPDNQCQECYCREGTVTCNKKRCRETCSHPTRTDGCCPVCDGCKYQGKLLENQAIFDSSTDPCLKCHCNEGTVTCNKKRCRETCSHPAGTDGCCPVCDGCKYEGKLLENQATFDSSVDPCLKCHCNRGSITCRTPPCPPVTCLNPVKVEGDCCLTCPMCVYLGKTFLDNQRFQHPEDLCQMCSCKMGRVECESERCPATCSHPRKDVCCPKCDACFFEDTLYANGLTFQPDSCRSCLCKDGNVVCEEQTCQSLPCLQTIRKEGNCCDSCQGCTFQGILYDEAASWVLPDNPCVTCSCHSGLVTCMDTQCFVPCSNPITLPGQCCPVCPSCSYEGQMYSDGQDFTPNGDPCDQCHCEDGYLRCIHDTCPNVASCPADSLRDPVPGSCCPTCAAELSTTCTKKEIGQIRRPRSNDPCLVCECKDDFMWVCTHEECPALACPPDNHIYSTGQCCPSCPACFDVSAAKFYSEGDEWNAVEDPCINCACKNGEVKCEVQKCESVTCKNDEMAIVLDGECCHSCHIVPDAICSYDGKTYQPGEQWIVDECTSCECKAGSVTCNVQKCPYAECPPEEVPIITPGQCCPVCQKRPGTCLVFGDPHYRTFDGATLHFQGTCRYIMARDCENDLFRVEIQHDNRGARGEVSWAQNITVSVAGSSVDLLQGNYVKVDGQLVDLPFLFEPHIQIERSGLMVLLSTDVGLRVLWDGSSYGEVIVAGTFKRQLCGLCGNFNGFPQDDLRTRAGQITNSPASFGNSWKSSIQLEEECQDAKDIDPCVAGGYRIRKMSTSRCAVLQSKAFSRCHRVVSPQPYFSSCVYDLCVCMDDPKCLCDIVTTYARECVRMGVRVEWRTQKLCAFDCDESKGLVFDECGPVCSRTCESVQAGGRNITENCFKPCVPSCQCTADKVLHNGSCISPSQCPINPIINTGE